MKLSFNNQTVHKAQNSQTVYHRTRKDSTRFNSPLNYIPRDILSSQQVAKYWSSSISSSNEYSGLIYFRVDWLDLLEVQGTLKSLLQHHSSKAFIFRCSAFFIVQLSRPHMTTGKTIALTRKTIFWQSNVAAF